LLNSHRPQLGAAVEGRGARSVVEVFETVLGSREAKWVRTVEDPLLRTPNNLVAMGDDKGRLKGFYVSNDHRRKVHWVSHFI
jgi:arylesterase/paraoxonase